MRLPKAVLDGVVLVPDAPDPAKAVAKRLAIKERDAIERARVKMPAAYHVFDLLHFCEHSLLQVALTERRRLLSKLLPDQGNVAFVDHVAMEGEIACEDAARAGVRVVAKLADSPYSPGERSSTWVIVEPVSTAVTPDQKVVVLSATEAAELASAIRTMNQASGTLRVGGVLLKLTNLDKVFWPGHAGWQPIPKRELLAYYAEVSPWLLGYLRDRPLTLRRYVDGIDGQSFYQRDWHYRSPDFVRIVPIYATSAERNFRAVVCDNLPTLLWLVNAGNVEMHPWYARCSDDGHGWPQEFADTEHTIESSSLNYPDFLVFDLDPWTKVEGTTHGEEKRVQALEECKTVAVLLRQKLEAWGLTTFVKTSGKTGLHVFVPIERRHRFEVTRELARRIAQDLAAAYPELVTVEWRVAKRGARVMIDHMQNARGKTLPAPYSVRATPAASVSMPLAWDDLAPADAYEFTILTVPARLREKGDAWAEMMDHRASIDAALRDMGVI
jgi:bifunctional non-homologous end joining protein LigD